MKRKPDVLIWLEDSDSPDMIRSVEYHRADNSVQVCINGSPVADMTPDLMEAITEAAALVAEFPTPEPQLTTQGETKNPFASPFQQGAYTS